MSGRSGYYQSLQIATNVENEETRRVGNPDFHHIHSNRYFGIRYVLVVIVVVVSIQSNVLLLLHLIRVFTHKKKYFSALISFSLPPLPLFLRSANRQEYYCLYLIIFLRAYTSVCNLRYTIYTFLNDRDHHLFFSIFVNYNCIKLKIFLLHLMFLSSLNSAAGQLIF